MISLEKKFIFVHIPKTAGTPIYNVLKKYEHWIEGLEHHAYLSDYEPYVDINDFFSFACVRNSWDRQLSWYFYNLGRAKKEFTGKGFVEFIRLQQREHHQSVAPQVDFIQPEVDAIMMFEDVQSDFDYVCDQIGIDRITLPYENVSANSKLNYRDYYTPEARDLVAKIYKQDIDRFNFTFE